MCYIAGFVNFNSNYNPLDEIKDKLDIIARKRGTDGAGFFLENNCSQVFIDKIYDSENLCREILPIYSSLVNFKLGMLHYRAEPSSNSEYIKDKDRETIDTILQPFLSKKIAITHNGTIANDRYFSHSHDGIDYKIDSSIFLNFDSIDDLYRVLKENKIKGSFSCAQYFREDKILALYRNYLPLSIGIDYENKVIWWDSDGEFINSINKDIVIIDVPPYSLFEIDLKDTFEHNANKIKLKIPRVLFNNKDDYNQKNLIICSGGLDSGVVTSYVANSSICFTSLLYFKSGFRAERKELEAVNNLAKYYGFDVKIINVSELFTKYLSSSLSSESKEEISEGDRGIEYSREWVPARNLIFSAIAVGFAEKNKYTHIYLGTNMEEASACPDNSLDFIKKLNDLIPFSVQNGVNIKVEAPLINLMKTGLVELGVQLNTPFELTYSCYKGEDEPCGVCSPCILRNRAMKSIIKEIK